MYNLPQCNHNHRQQVRSHRTGFAEFESGRRILIVDHDGGADDAMALVMAILYERHNSGIKLIALTTTHANIHEPQCYINTQRILSDAGVSDIPIYRGSNFSLIENVETDYFFGINGLGDLDSDYKPIAAQKEHAVSALIEYSKKYDGELEILALGALTNIALAIRLDPSFMSRLKQLYIAAGHVFSAEYSAPEFNAAADVESYKVVADASLPDIVTVMPFSQIKMSSKADNVTMDWRKNVLGAIETDIMGWLNKYETKAWGNINASGSVYWTFLDPFAMALVLRPDLITEMMYTRNDIILCRPYRGITTNEFATKYNANMKLVNAVSAKNYQSFLFDLFNEGTIRSQRCQYYNSDSDSY